MGRFLNEAYLRRTYLQGRLHVLAGKIARTCVENAVHCKGGCSALRLKWVKLATESSALLWTGEKEGKTHPIWVTVSPRKFLLSRRTGQFLTLPMYMAFLLTEA